MTPPEQRAPTGDGPTRREATALFEKADRAVAAARLALTADDTDTAVSRLYYAAFYAARAALLLGGEHPKTHAGVITRFRERFERTGILDPSVARTLAYAFSARLRTDYEAFTVFDVSSASDLLRDVEAFVTAVRGIGM